MTGFVLMNLRSLKGFVEVDGVPRDVHDDDSGLIGFLPAYDTAENAKRAQATMDNPGDIVAIGDGKVVEEGPTE